MHCLILLGCPQFFLHIAEAGALHKRERAFLSWRRIKVCPDP